MYQTIMVPTEGTGFDREAIKVALRLAGKSDAQIHLVRVAKPAALVAAAGGLDSVVLAGEAQTAQRDLELSELYMLAAECRGITSAPIITSLEVGPVGDVLEAYAARVAPDLIVISSHGRHGIARLSLGSVTDALIRNAHVPVLVVKPESSYLNPRAAERFKQMIIPLDGSSLAEQILEPAIALAEYEQAEIILLQVIVDTDKATMYGTHSWWEEEVATAHAYLARIASRIRRSGLSVSSDIVIGTSVSEAIASFARSHRAELVAIATHGRSGLQRAIRGSVADELARTAPMSILVLHPQQQSSEKLPEAPQRELVQAGV